MKDFIGELLDKIPSIEKLFGSSWMLICSPACLCLPYYQLLIKNFS